MICPYIRGWKIFTTSDVFDFLSYLANDRNPNPDSPASDYGISPGARARKLSAIKSFYKYLTVRTKQLQENPVADLEYPKLRKSLPKYLTFQESAALLQSFFQNLRLELKDRPKWKKPIQKEN